MQTCRKCLKVVIKVRKPRPKTRLFSEEQEKFIRDNAKGRYNNELTKMVNEKYGLNITVKQMSTWKKNHGVSSGLTGRFKKGQVPWNKGLKGLNLGGKETQFKKGQVPHNYREVGSERIDKKEGYIYVKVKEKGTYQERWKHKQIVVWEKHHGKLPENHVVVFLDQNKMNTDINNLECISRAELAMMNKYNLFSNEPKITKAAISLVKLMLKTNEIEFKGEKYREYVEIAERNGVSEWTFLARLKRGWTFEQAAKLPLYTKVTS